MEWLARSANCETGESFQTYARHILGVRAYAERYLVPLIPILRQDIMNILRTALFPAVEFHDLGKLEDNNQAVLREMRHRKALPIDHSDAGVVKLRNDERVQAALLVASHHKGLLSFPYEQNRGENYFRAEIESKRMRTPLEVLLGRHCDALTGKYRHKIPLKSENYDSDISRAVFFRIALSCLVDADHSDSSTPNRPLDEIDRERQVPLLPESRLLALDAYVARFETKTERDVLRGAIYAACRAQTPDERIVACDSPVGSGKTTAVMAHLLSIARKRGLRRIFVVLPFTNIIRQSAEVYRKALVLPNEDPDDIVAEVHHLADFDDEASREYATQWNAPIIVTTAVAFFETLAAARPSALRRLHELVGSAVFVDEAHAALPARLLPIAYRWMNVFANDWNVHWVLASGSLVRFWEMQEIVKAAGFSKICSIPFLATESVRDRSSDFEKSRVRFETILKPLSVDELQDIVLKTAGPRIVILNTVQNAAIVARAFARDKHFADVFHLSTALTPVDRERTLAAVRTKLESNPDGDWVLVGTSCIEAGMDLDFATGFREVSSLTSLLQASGRVNRSGRRSESKVFSFSLREEGGVNRNRNMEDSIHVMRDILREGKPVDAALCTEALRRELRLDPRSESLLSKVGTAEDQLDFPEVKRLVQIISDDTRTVIVDADMIERIESFQPVSWRDIQRNSVQLWGARIAALHVPELNRHPGIFKWHLNYSSFLGCMEGVLEQEDFTLNGGSIL